MGMVNMHHHSKFHQNQSNGFGDIAFNGFQNGSHLLSWITKNLNFWTDITVRRLSVHQQAKFHRNWL